MSPQALLGAVCDKDCKTAAVSAVPTVSELLRAGQRRPLGFVSLAIHLTASVALVMAMFIALVKSGNDDHNMISDWPCLHLLVCQGLLFVYFLVNGFVQAWLALRRSFEELPLPLRYRDLIMGCCVWWYIVYSLHGNSHCRCGAQNYMYNVVQGVFFLHVIDLAFVQHRNYSPSEMEVIFDGIVGKKHESRRNPNAVAAASKAPKADKIRRQNTFNEASSSGPREGLTAPLLEPAPARRDSLVPVV